MQNGRVSKWMSRNLSLKHNAVEKFKFNMKKRDSYQVCFNVIFGMKPKCHKSNQMSQQTCLSVCENVCILA